MSTGTALPDQIVPRASASSRRWLVAEATALASQAAGANSDQADERAERRTPAIAQRTAAPR